VIDADSNDHWFEAQLYRKKAPGKDLDSVVGIGSGVWQAAIGKSTTGAWVASRAVCAKEPGRNNLNSIT
jgi:hypothetical protein